MKKLLAAAAIAVILPATAIAQESDAERADALEQCLIDASGPDENETFRSLFRALLDEDVERVESIILGIQDRLIKTAIKDCGAPEDIASQAWAADIPGNYMSAMTVNVFSDVLEALGG